MLVHEFVALQKDSISTHVSYDVIKQTNFVSVPDEVILANIKSFITGFSSYWDSFESPNKGLNYHGITIIPPDEVPHFLRALNRLETECSIKNLIMLCKDAVYLNKHIVHFGI